MTVSALLVDDDPSVRALLRVAFRARGRLAVVGEAATGAEAGRLAAQLRPDVVVLDLGLPDMAATDVLGLVRRSSATSRIVIFSGMGSDRSWFEDRADGYVVKDAELDDLLDLVEEVARSPHDEAMVELAHDPIAAREARAVVRNVLVHWGRGDLLDKASLVVSELVTNAVQHAASTCLVVVSRTAEGIRVAVRDTGPGTPAVGSSDQEDERGRGMMIVEALASAWGVDVEGASKTVWVDLAAPATADSR